MKDRPLRGKNIVVTRPARQARELAALIRQAGGNPVVFPVMEIRDVRDPQPLLRLIERLGEFDLAIFISPNAVNKAMKLISARGSLPSALKVAAIGRGTMKELARFGVTGVTAPAGSFDSEALLDLPALADVGGRRVVIFRGEGGRELLGDTLKARGAAVEYAECYRRGKPNLDAAPLLRAWARNELHAITVTSGEGLRNLFEMVGTLGRGRLKKTPLFVPHPRIEEAARALGIATVIVTESGDEGLVAGLSDYFDSRREQRHKETGNRK
jgi:uroporphyrinogen-III synthase